MTLNVQPAANERVALACSADVRRRRTGVYTTSRGSSGTRDVDFSAWTVRYLRVYCTNANSSGYRITELEAWGVPASGGAGDGALH